MTEKWRTCRVQWKYKGKVYEATGKVKGPAKQAKALLKQRIKDYIKLKEENPNLPVHNDNIVEKSIQAQ